FFLVALAVSLASIAHAEDVTLFTLDPRAVISAVFSLCPWRQPHFAYVYSEAYSWIERPLPSGIDADGKLTLSGTVTSTLPGDSGNGTYVCQYRFVVKEEGTTRDRFHGTITGTPSPGWTIKGAHLPSPTGDDEGGADRAIGHSKLIGFIATSTALGVGFILGFI
ncbi:hypothetical protein BKA70DRAFT_1269664, partial [Coprinopsis sp. MPI-PUGE-AT-0042]